MLPQHGRGNGSFPLPACTSIATPASAVDTTSTNPSSNERSVEAVRLAGIRTAAIIMPISRERNDSDYCLNSSYSLSWRTLLCIITNVA